MLQAKDLSRLINRNGGALLDQIEQDEIQNYLYIRDQVSEGDVVNDEHFRSTYRELYDLGGKRITSEFKDKYFTVLQEAKEEDRFDFLSTYRSLYGAKQKQKIKPTQFEQLTQMANVISEDYPIYEKPMGEVFGFKRPASSLNSRERLREYLKFYQHLRDTYRHMLAENQVYDVLKVFKLKFRKEGKETPHMKRLDFLTRAAAQLQTKGQLV